LDGFLAKQRFAVGDRLTVADFSLGALLNTHPVTKFPLDQYPNIARWYQSLTELPGWQKALGHVDKAA
jgi:glutathione S-transferase